MSVGDPSLDGTLTPVPGKTSAQDYVGMVVTEVFLDDQGYLQFLFGPELILQTSPLRTFDAEGRFLREAYEARRRERESR